MTTGTIKHSFLTALALNKYTLEEFQKYGIISWEQRFEILQTNEIGGKWQIFLDIIASKQQSQEAIKDIQARIIEKLEPSELQKDLNSLFRDVVGDQDYRQWNIRDGASTGILSKPLEQVFYAANCQERLQKYILEIVKKVLHKNSSFRESLLTLLRKEDLAKIADKIGLPGNSIEKFLSNKEILAYLLPEKKDEIIKSMQFGCLVKALSEEELQTVMTFLLDLKQFEELKGSLDKVMSRENSSAKSELVSQQAHSSVERRNYENDSRERREIAYYQALNRLNSNEKLDILKTLWKHKLINYDQFFDGWVQPTPSELILALTQILLRCSKESLEQHLPNFMLQVTEPHFLPSELKTEDNELDYKELIKNLLSEEPSLMYTVFLDNLAPLTINGWLSTSDYQKICACATIEDQLSSFIQIMQGYSKIGFQNMLKSESISRNYWLNQFQMHNIINLRKKYATESEKESTLTIFDESFSKYPNIELSYIANLSELYGLTGKSLCGDNIKEMPEEEARQLLMNALAKIDPKRLQAFLEKEIKTDFESWKLDSRNYKTYYIGWINFVIDKLSRKHS